MHLFVLSVVTTTPGRKLCGAFYIGGDDKSVQHEVCCCCVVFEGDNKWIGQLAARTAGVPLWQEGKQPIS